MDRRCFVILCYLLRTTVELVRTKVINVVEMIAMFLYILTHDVKNGMIQKEFVRYGEIISRHFNIVLLVALCLHVKLLKNPQPVPNSCTDSRWKWFEVSTNYMDVSCMCLHMCMNNCNFIIPQNFLGVLDDPYIMVNVSTIEHLRYRTRKGKVATNLIGFCDTKDDFVFALAGNDRQLIPESLEIQYHDLTD
ncbi:hypothetical protein IC575_009158 [Cucumis melo]